MIGVPTGMPVADAASACTVPTTSAGHTSLGNGMCPQMRCAQSVFQSKSRVPYSGSHWLAVWWSIAYSPVSLAEMYEFDPYHPVAFSNTSGSWLRTHSSFGPTAWLDSAVPAFARMASAPNSAVNESISAVALESMP